MPSLNELLNDSLLNRTGHYDNKKQFIKNVCLRLIGVYGGDADTQTVVEALSRQLIIELGGSCSDEKAVDAFIQFLDENFDYATVE